VWTLSLFIQFFGGTFVDPPVFVWPVVVVDGLGARSASRNHPINTNSTAPRASATGDQLPLSRRM
jgi:hypothetical protein